MISIIGYDHLGHQQPEGLRFAWGDERFSNLVESAAFNTRTKLGGEEICAYTTSVSSGCILRSQGISCVFCRTGKVLPFGGLLTTQEIAKQNVFMVLADMHCDDHPELRNRPREFAYMGQGEPGYSYSQLRQAIEITNSVMKKLGQIVYRHIFSTSGIPEAIQAYKNDVKGYFTERVTLHLSLHAAEHRSLLMPVNQRYPLTDVLKQTDDLYALTGEKVCVGIMLFWNFKSKGSEWTYSNTMDNAAQLLSLLNPDKYRLSFCEFNPSPELGSADIYPETEAQRLLQLVNERGFEAKLFSSFGRDEQTACGMLGGKQPGCTASEKWKELDEMAEELIEETM